MEPQENVTTNQVEQVSTQPVEQTIEEKTDTQPAVTENIQSETLNESPLEGSETNVNEPEGIVTPTEDKNPVEGTPEVSDEIKQKLDRLAEYELKDRELTDLKGRLGIQNQQVPDNQIFAAQQELAIVENQATQEYIRLCNEYGVDYRPDKIEASGKELLEKDPKAFYDLRYKLENLNNSIESKRNMVNNFIQQREFATAFQRNKQVLDASPAIAKVVNDYVQSGSIAASDIDNIVGASLSIAREAYEMGRQAALAEKQTVSPAKVLNNNTISQQGNLTPPPSEGLKFTIEDIQNMDMETFKKHQKEIDRLYLS